MFGGWSIDKAVFDAIVRLVPPQGRLVELGSGRTSPLFAERFDVISFEHDIKWIVPRNERPARWQQVYAPLKNGWYDPNVLEGVLGPVFYDVLLIDGPPGGAARLGIVQHLRLFDWGAHVVVDDTHRQHEKALVPVLMKHVEMVRPCRPHAIMGRQKSATIL